MFRWYRKTVFENYSNFRGRATSREYWYFALINIALALGFFYLDTLLGINFEPNSGGPFYVVFLLGTIVPGFAVAVRRMHDLNKSGWNLLLFFVPIIGFFWVIFLLADDGTAGDNNYGPYSGLKRQPKI